MAHHLLSLTNVLVLLLLLLPMPLPQMLKDLPPSRTAGLFAVALNVAACSGLNSWSLCEAVKRISSIFHRSRYIAAAELPEAAAEALLRLAV